MLSKLWSKGVAAALLACLIAGLSAIQPINAGLTTLGAGRSVAGGAAVTPLTICAGANYVGWWDSQDVATITESGGLVSQWNDKGTGGDNLTASGTARPTIAGSGSSTTITFDDVANVMATATDGISIGTTDKMAAWAVGQRITGVDLNDRLLAYVGTGSSSDFNFANSAVLILETASNTIGGYRSAAKATKAVTLNTTSRMLSLWDGTNHDMFVNNVGATPVASTGNFGATGTLLVGGGGNFPVLNNWGAYIVKEVVVCAGLTITSGIRSDMETYFTGRW